MDRKLSTLILLSSVLVSCATGSRGMGENQQDDMATYVEVVDQAAPEDLDGPLLETQNQALKKIQAIADENQNKRWPKYTINTRPGDARVQKWIKYYSVKDRERFQRFLNRGARYKAVIQDLLIANGLPPDLYFLGILESGYVSKAVSHAGAVGPWQFMAPTGRQYGLKINGYVDERIDPIRSTLAAIRYLKELHRQKKSWPLALAAYNAGPGRVRRAMRRGSTMNYWTLTKRRLLPYDTREYIPQFLAILTIGQNLDEYGFEEKAKNPLPVMELVKVPSPVTLEKIADMSEIPLKRLHKLNAHLLKGMTPPGKKDYHVWVDGVDVNRLQNSYAQLTFQRIKGLKEERAFAGIGPAVHRVRRGQNLSTIARRYGTSVSRLKQWNNLRSNRIFVGQRLKVKGARTQVARSTRKPPIASSKRSVASAKSSSGTKRLPVASAKNQVQKYKIRSGDNLHKIARRFGMTVRQIKTLNNLRSNRILRGQYLIVASNDQLGSGT